MKMQRVVTFDLMEWKWAMETAALVKGKQSFTCPAISDLPRVAPKSFELRASRVKLPTHH